MVSKRPSRSRRSSGAMVGLAATPARARGNAARARRPERRLAHRGHHVLREEALHQRERHGLRGVVADFDLRLLRAGAEERAGRRFAESLGDHRGGARFAGSHEVRGLAIAHLAQVESGIGAHRGHDGLRHGAPVEVDYRHRNARGLLRRTAQHCAEEGGDEDRRGKSHHERAAIGKVEDEVLLHEGDEGVHGQSLSWRPVRCRKTSSSVGPRTGLGAGAGASVRSSASVPFATIRPWSMMRMRSQRRSASSM